MLKNLISLSLVCAISVCSVGNLGYAVTNEETARKIAAIFSEQEEKSLQKLNLESGKRQKLEDENKALLEELQKLKAEKENKALLEEMQKLKAEKNSKELQQELKNLKNSKSKAKSPSVWSSIKTWFSNITGVLLGVIAAGSAVLGLGAGAAGIWTAGTAVYDCHTDENCKSFTEKITEEGFKKSFDSINKFILELMKNINIHTVFVKDTNE